MSRKYFGTDGVRGTANSEPITPDTVLRLAMAAGHRFRRGDHRHTVVIGKDTRLSGYMLEPALTAGFISMGMDVVLLDEPADGLRGNDARGVPGGLELILEFREDGTRCFCHACASPSGADRPGPRGFRFPTNNGIILQSISCSGH